MKTNLQTPQEAIAAASAGGAKVVDIRFTDLFGVWQHFSIPAREFTLDLFDEGIGFDGSSIRGFQPINLTPDEFYIHVPCPSSRAHRKFT